MISSPAHPEETITDALGRKIVMQELNVVEQARLLRAIGPDQTLNRPYVNMVESAACARVVDGHPLSFPYTERQIDGMLSRLGDDGVAASIQFAVQKMQARMDAAQASIDSDTPSQEAGGRAADPLVQSA